MVSKCSTNIPILDLDEQLHTYPPPSRNAGANPSRNSFKPWHLQEITSQILVSSQIHQARCKPPSQHPVSLLQPAQVSSTNNLTAPLPHAVNSMPRWHTRDKKHLGTLTHISQPRGPEVCTRL